MGRNIYYIVQTAPTMFVHKGNLDLDHVEGFGAEKAAHLSLSEARKLYRVYRAVRQEGAPFRFPRILKATVEMKTITNN